MRVDKMTNAVVCTGVEKWFGADETRIQVLRKLDLTINMGELAMLVGPSGCGKTTLISVITGLLDPTAGIVEVLGERPHDMAPQNQILFRRENMGFVFQQFNLLPALTAAENAAVPLFVAGWKRNQAVEKASELLNLLGLSDRTRSLPSQLSGGEQQRVALARAVIHEPRLIVCDEPTSALDAKNGMKVMELLSEVSVRPDRAVIVVTHDSRVFEFADTIAHMEDGRITQIEQSAGVRAASPAHWPSQSAVGSVAPAFG
jgi:putative ABC transport system ATP-binding protein